MRSSRTARSAALVALVCVKSGCQLVTQYMNPARWLLEQARELEAEEKYPEAVAKYELIIQKYPKKKYAKEALSRAAAIHEERLNNWQKAAMYLQELRARDEGKKPYPAILLRLGRVLEHGGSPYTDALETYGVICKNCATAPESLTALLARGRLYEAMQSWPQAKSVYEDAIQKLGAAPQAGAVRARLQSVWLMEALGMYSAGRVHEGAALAAEALKKPLDVSEVRGGLESLDRQYANAKRLWAADAGTIVLEERGGKLVEALDEGHFPLKAVRDQGANAPDGWEASFDVKKKSLAITRRPTDGAQGKPWSFKAPSEAAVLGFWWSPDGKRLAWIGKSREGRRRTLNIVDLVKHKSWEAVRDASGSVLGETVLFLPYCDKMVFPYEDYLAISDLRGGSRTNHQIKGDRTRRFRGAQVEWIASSVDGLELAVAVTQPPPKGGAKPKKGAPPPDAPRPAIWKLSLGVLQE